MNDKLYTLEEAHVHWQATIERCTSELKSAMQAHSAFVKLHEKNTITR